MNIIEALVVTLGLDSASFVGGAGKATSANDDLNKSLGETQKQTEKTTKEQEKGTKSLLGFTKQIIEAKKNLLSFVEVYVGVKVFKTITQEVTESESALYRLSSRIHTSVQDLQAWGNAAEIMGGNADEARQGLANLSNDLTALRYMGQSSGRTDFIAQMGVYLQDANGKTKDLIQIQEELGDAVEQRMKQGMSREDAHNLLHQKGFDESTIQLLLTEHNKRKELLAEQREYNKLSDAQAEKTQELQGNWRRLGQSFTTLKQNMFVFFAPLLNFLVKCAIGVMHLVNSFPKLSGALGTLLMAFFPLLGMLRILKLFGGLRSIFSGLGGGGRFLGVLRSIGGAIGRLLPMLLRAGVFLVRLTTLFGLLSKPIVLLIAVLGFLIKDLLDFGNNGQSIVPWAKIFDGIHSVIEWFGTLSDKLGDVWDKLKNRDWSGAWSSFKGIFTGGDGGATAGGVDGGAGGVPAPKAEAAAEFAIKHAAAGSTGWCATYVNDALRAQGIAVNGNGKDVAGNLIAQNKGKFQSIAYSKDYVPQIGDVMSITADDPANKARQGKKYGSNRPGHVAIYTKDGWVSDFKQGNKYGNTGAANQAYYDGIVSGQNKVTIARMINPNGGAMSAGSGLNGKGNTKYDSLILAAARRHGIDPALLKAMVHTESQFNPNARSPVGAQGLMQLMPATARRFGVQNAWNPAENIEGGAKYMAYLLKYYHGDRNKAIAAYNGGEGNINKYGVGWVRENRDYVKRVNSHYGTYAGMGRNGMAQIPNVTPSTLSAMNNSHLYANNTARSSEVNIGSININTQATDPHGIARSIPAALSNTFSGLAYGMDSGMNT